MDKNDYSQKASVAAGVAGTTAVAAAPAYCSSSSEEEDEVAYLEVEATCIELRVVDPPKPRGRKSFCQIQLGSRRGSCQPNSRRVSMHWDGDGLNELPLGEGRMWLNTLYGQSGERKLSRGSCYKLSDYTVASPAGGRSRGTSKEPPNYEEIRETAEPVYASYDTPPHASCNSKNGHKSVSPPSRTGIKEPPTYEEIGERAEMMYASYDEITTAITIPGADGSVAGHSNPRGSSPRRVKANEMYEARFNSGGSRILQSKKLLPSQAEDCPGSPAYVSYAAVDKATSDYDTYIDITPAVDDDTYINAMPAVEDDTYINAMPAVSDDTYIYTTPAVGDDPCINTISGTACTDESCLYSTAADSGRSADDKPQCERTSMAPQKPEESGDHWPEPIYANADDIRAVASAGDSEAGYSNPRGPNVVA